MIGFWWFMVLFSTFLVVFRTFDNSRIFWSFVDTLWQRRPEKVLDPKTPMIDTGLPRVGFAGQKYIFLKMK